MTTRSRPGQATRPSGRKQALLAPLLMTPRTLAGAYRRYVLTIGMVLCCAVPVVLQDCTVGCRYLAVLAAVGLQYL